MLSNKNILIVISFALVTAFNACKQDNSKDTDKESSDLTTATTSETLDTAFEVNLNNPLADEAITLRLNPPKGTVYWIETTASFTSDERMDTLRMKGNSSKWVKSKLVVKDNNEKQVIFEYMLTDERKNVKNDSMQLTYQYGKPNSNPDQEIDRKIEDCLINSPLTLKLDKFGTGSDVQGYEAILKKVKAIVGENMPDQLIASNLGSPTENVEYFFITYPEKALKIGDTWTQETPSIMQGVPITLYTTYTLADRKDGVAYINFTTAISVDKSKLPSDFAAEVDKIKFDAWIKGAGQINESTGFPIVMQVTQAMEVNDDYQGVKTHSKQSGTTTIRLIQ